MSKKISNDFSVKDIIRAWKDPEYRSRLGAERQAKLPAHPAGEIETAQKALKHLNGKFTHTIFDNCTWFCTPTINPPCPDDDGHVESLWPDCPHPSQLFCPKA